MTHAFVDPEVKLVTRWTTKLLRKCCPITKSNLLSISFKTVYKKFIIQYLVLIQFNLYWKFIIFGSVLISYVFFIYMLDSFWPTVNKVYIYAYIYSLQSTAVLWLTQALLCTHPQGWSISRMVQWYWFIEIFRSQL